MLYALTLFAQAVEDGKKAVEDAKKDEGPGALVNFMPIILIVIVFYFLIFLPGRKEKQQRQSMISALKKNDKVITSGGVIGVVVNLKEGTEEVTIRSEDTRLLILRSSIARIITEPEKEPSTPKAG
jgi:preprotein translocase subunit YajC